MDRREALSQLKRMASDANEMVDRLDHPFLLAPPDALVRWGRNIVACFIAAEGWTIPTALRDRVILSRLALPYSVQHVLLHDPRFYLGDNTDPSFDAILPLEGALSRVVNEGGRNSSSPPDFVRKMHNERFSTAWEETLNPTPGKLEQLTYNQENTTAFRAFRTKGQGRSTGPLTESGLRQKIDASRGARSVRDAIASGVKFAARADYLTDLGGEQVAADLLQDERLGLAFHVNEIEGDLPPSHSSDPEKTLRAAAFAGIITTIRRG